MSRKTAPRALLGALACALAFAAPASGATFSNPGAITIAADAGNGSPYPSTIEVAGTDAFVSDVDVTLNGVKHQHAEDFDIALVAPSGRSIALVSDACDTADTVSIDANWTFDAAASAEIPAVAPCATGTFRPRDHDPASAPDDWPAGDEPDGSTLDDLVGEDADGTWKLYVADDAEHADDDGRIQGGWSLSIESKPAPAPVRFSVASATVPEGGTLTVDVVRPNVGDLEAGSVTVGTVGGSALAGQDFTPVSQTLTFAPGERRKTVSVPVLADGGFEPAQDFSLVLGLPRGDAAVASPAAVGVTIPQDAQGPVDDTPKGDQVPPPQQPFTRTNAIPNPPSAGRCRRIGEQITFRPKMPRGVAILGTEVYVNGALVEDNVGVSAIAPIVLRMTGRRMRVRIRLHAHDGRTVSVRRTFRACGRRS